MAAAVVSAAFAQGLADLDVNPDDVMLRRPAPAAAKSVQEKKAREAAAARMAAEKRAREAAVAKAAAERAAAEKRALDEAAARASAEKRALAEKRAREEAVAKAAAERDAAEKKARDDAAELKRLREQVAAEQRARAKAQAEKTDVEMKAAAARKAADAALRKAVDEKAALAAQAAAERKAADAALEKANAAKEEAERRAQRLARVEPDERPQPPKRLESPDEPATAPQQEGVKVVSPRKAPKKVLTGRPAVITAGRTDYDRKEGVILFDRSVHVDDEQYQMHADRLFVFLDGTNDLKRLVALGNVAITNDLKTAHCARAVYNRAAQRIVMFGDGDDKPARLRDAGGRNGDASEVMGGRITYWLETGMATVEEVKVTLPAMKGGGTPKELFNIGGGSAKDRKKD